MTTNAELLLAVADALRERDPDFWDETFPGLLGSEEFGRIVAAHHANDDPDMIVKLQRLLYILLAVKRGIYDAPRLKESAQEHNQSNADRQKILEHLRDAAKLKGLPPDFYIDLERKNRPTVRIRDVDHHAQYPEERRNSSETEQQWLKRIAAVPNIGPVTNYIGKRGGASKPDGATRGLIVRVITPLVPTGTRHRWAVISGLLGLADIEIDRHSVRKMALKRETAQQVDDVSSNKALKLLDKAMRRRTPNV